jgi:hypothetical protein
MQMKTMMQSQEDERGLDIKELNPTTQVVKKNSGSSLKMKMVNDTIVLQT